MIRKKSTKKLNPDEPVREWTGIFIPAETWLDDNLTLLEKHFFIEIKDLDNNDGCYASNKHFSKFAKISKGRCSQIINSLLKKGYIKIHLHKKGKQIIKRTIRVVNILEGGGRYPRGGYLENDKESIPKESIPNLEKDIYPKNKKVDLNKLKKDKTKAIPKKKDLIQKSYINLTKKLINIIQTHRKINVNSNLNNWSKDIEKLVSKDLNINGFSHREIIKRVNDGLKFYGKNIGKKYIPVIHSAKSFREKFSKLEDAIKRETQDNEPKKVLYPQLPGAAPRSDVVYGEATDIRD